MDKSVNKTGIILMMAVAAFLGPFMGSSMNVALPVIGKDLNLSAVILGWMQSSYLLAGAIFLVPLGRLADMYGRRRFFLGGFVLFSLVTLGLAFVSNAESLLILRALQGFSGSIAFSTTMPILISIFDKKDRGMVIGISGAATYTGLAMGPFLGGIITELWGWRVIFILIIPFAMGCVFAGQRLLREEWTPAKGESFDFWGMFYYGVTLTMMILGFTFLPKISGALLLGGSILFFGVFVWHELRCEVPLLNLRLLQKNTVFAFSNLAALINYSATFSVGFMLSIYLQNVRGLSPREAGIVLVSQPIMMAIFSPLAGRSSDRIEPQYLASIGMAITTLVLFFFGFIGIDTPMWMIYVNLSLLGISFALFAAPNTNAVMSSVDKSLLSVASGTLGTMRMTGQMMSMGVATLVFALILGNDPLTSEHKIPILQSTQLIFFMSSALCFFGIIASISRGKTFKSD